MKLNNLEINWNKVKKIVGVGVILVTIEGGLLFDTENNMDIQMPVENTPTSKSIVEPKAEVYSDIYGIKVMDNKIYSEHATTYTIDPSVGIDANGNKYYYLPEGYCLYGNKGYKHVSDYELISYIEDEKSYNK